MGEDWFSGLITQVSHSGCRKTLSRNSRQRQVKVKVKGNVMGRGEWRGTGKVYRNFLCPKPHQELSLPLTHHLFLITPLTA